jgi:hypothetical protein
MKLVKGTRVRTPSGRFARVTEQGVTSDGQVHLVYYDGDESPVSFPARLLCEADIITPPRTHIDPEPEGTTAPEFHIYSERSGLSVGRVSGEGVPFIPVRYSHK